MTIRLDPTGALSPSRQLVLAVLDRIARGAWTAGDRLPSVRGLAREAGVNANTVSKVYRELEALGVVEGRERAGVFVTPGGPKTARAKRRGATLAALMQALESSLQAGHSSEMLRRHVERRLDKEQADAATPETSRTALGRYGKAAG